MALTIKPKLNLFISPGTPLVKKPNPENRISIPNAINPFTLSIFRYLRIFLSGGVDGSDRMSASA